MKVQEYSLSRALFYLMASLILAACGSGGDDTAQLKATSSYTLTTSLASSSVTPTGTTTVTVTLKDGSGSPASGQTVQLVSTGSASLSTSSVTTDATGKATATLSGNNASIGATGTVTATHTDSNGASTSKSTSYSILDSENVFITLSKSSVNSGTGDSVTLTGVVINSSGQILSNKQISYSLPGGPSDGVITSSGDTSATYAPSSVDRSNKQVSIVATVVGSTATATSTVSVVGTAVQLTSATTSAKIGDVISLQGTLKDGNGSAIGNTSVVLSSSNMDLDTTTAGVQSTLTVTTAANGSIPATSVEVKSSTSNAASVTATALGSSSTLSVSVSGTSFSFSTPAANTEIVVNTPTTFTITYLSNGVGVSGKQIFFSSSLGTVTGSPATTDSSGKASVTVSSSSAGQAVVSANVGDAPTVQSSQQVSFISTTPASISVQAGQTGLVSGAQTSITATVLDAANNPVKGKVVEFSVISDPSNGIGLSAPIAVTDSSGKASVSYTAGTQSTATNAVQIKAKVQNTAIETQAPPATPSHALLTVGGSALFISLTSGNTLIENDSTTYSDPRGVLVTDALGNPVVNKTLTLSVIPVKYYKGVYTASGSRWVAVTSASCSNEDLDSDGIIDSGEDLNGNGVLDPGSPVTLSTATVTTNAQGLASFNVLYGQGYGNWLRVKLKATASVSGTESVAAREYDLAITADDADVTKGAPPGGGTSPFGSSTSCLDTN